MEQIVAADLLHTFWVLARNVCGTWCSKSKILWQIRCHCVYKTPSTVTDKRNLSDSIKCANKANMNRPPQFRGEDDSNIEPQADLQQFSIAGVQEFLKFDPRPTLIVSRNTIFEEGTIDPEFYNPAFHSQLFYSICRKPIVNSHLDSPKTSSSEFRSWMAGKAQFKAGNSGSVSKFAFCGYIWITFPLKDRWVVFSGSQKTQEFISGHEPEDKIPEGKASPPISKDTNLPRATSAAVLSKLLKTIPPAPSNFVTPGTPDWTITHPVGELSPHITFARSIDWASTSLGGMDTWSKEFRQVANLLMRNPHAAALFWGEDLTCLYNKAYADIVAGQKHPGLMGTGFRGPFAELWNSVSATFDECVKTYV